MFVMSRLSSAWWQAFREADTSVYWKAGIEVLVIGGLSILPLALAAYGTFILQSATSKPPFKAFSDILWAAILNGQLYFYAMTFIAAVVFHSAQDMKARFPLRLLFWCVSFLLGMLCAFFFGVAPALPSTGVPEISLASIVVYIISALMYFLILAFKAMDPPDLERHTRESDEDLTRRVRERRGLEQ